MNYREQVNALLDKQDAKGASKYGQPLEQSGAEIGERLQHLAEELTDGLRYALWAQDGIYNQGMSMDRYQELAERTANRGPDDSYSKRLTNFSMGLSGETGEVVDYLKKVIFHGHALDSDKLCRELGDCLWYIATIASTAGIPLSEVAKTNIEKLKARYPDGFSEERSRSREKRDCSTCDQNNGLTCAKANLIAGSENCYSKGYKHWQPKEDAPCK